MTITRQGKKHEVGHALRAELEFKAIARRNKKLGLWLAGEMGLSGDAAEAYAREVVIADLDKPGEDDLMAKIMGDIRARGLTIPESVVIARKEEYLRLARGEIEDEAAAK